MEKEKTTSRQELIPHFSQKTIRNTRVGVIGAGATANEVLKCLALTGFGYVYISDMDFISTSNLSRTVLFTEHDIGDRKAVVAAERFTTMNIDNGVADYFDGDICHGLGDGVIRHLDLVIGCVDNEQTRLYISNICQMLKKPYIDTGIGGLNWNVFTSSGQDSCPCYACTLGQKSEEKALSRIRNSCDVTRRKAAQEGHVPTIGISAAAAAALAVQEAIKISHYLKNPMNTFLPPRFGVLSLFTAQENELKHVQIPLRSSCEHHDHYDNYGGVTESPISAHWTLKDTLAWVRNSFGSDYEIALFKDCTCADRGFVTKAHCEHCGVEIDVYRPQPLDDADMLCPLCKENKCAPIIPSDATLKVTFSSEDEERLQLMTLLELGVPLFHILEFAPKGSDGNSLFIELTGDLQEVMPNLC